MIGCNTPGLHMHNVLSGAEWSAAVIADLQATGQRLTASRLALLEYLAATPNPFTVEDVARAYTDCEHPGSRSTLYRLVSWLEERGWLGRVVGPHGDERVLARELPGHFPAVCTACGMIALVGGLKPASLMKVEHNAPPFHVDRVRLQFDGRCAACQAVGLRQ